MKTSVALIAGGMVFGALAPAFAQAPVRSPESPQSAASALRDPRYQIGLMEGILKTAAEHGAKVTRDRVRAVVPGDLLLSDEVRVRGFRLDGYGVFFDIDMPDLESTLPYVYRTLDQNDLGLDSALRAIRSLAESSGNPNDRQALQRIELQLAPMMSPASRTGAAGPTVSSAQSATGSAAATTTALDKTTPKAPPDLAVLSDPQAVYRAEVIDALVEAMLDYSRGLRLEATDWLTVAARGKEGPPRLSPADTDSPTFQLSVRGADLIALLAGQIDRDEARKRVQIKVF